MLWKEGLLIKFEKLSIKGRMYNWIKAFLIGRSIRVKVGDDISSSAELPKLQRGKAPQKHSKSSTTPPPTHTHTHTHTFC